MLHSREIKSERRKVENEGRRAAKGGQESGVEKANNARTEEEIAIEDKLWNEGYRGIVAYMKIKFSLEKVNQFSNKSIPKIPNSDTELLQDFLFLDFILAHRI